MESTPCPRCGYELSGTIATWTDRCPLEGRCAECGLRFAWGRLLVLAEHPWLFEYYWRRRPLYRLVRTWLAALRPRRFWREVRMTDPIQLRPLGAVVGGLFVAMLAAGYAVGRVDRYDWFQYWSQPRFALSRKPPGAGSWPNFLASGLVELAEGIVTAVPGFFVALFAMPLVFLLLPQTLGRARVRPAHFVRIWFYSMLFSLAALGACAAVQAVLLAAGPADVNAWSGGGRMFFMRHPVWATFAPFLTGCVPMLLYAAWGAWWSWCGCRYYLRLTCPGRIVATLTLIVVLAAVCAQMWALVA